MAYHFSKSRRAGEIRRKQTAKQRPLCSGFPMMGGFCGHDHGENRKSMVVSGANANLFDL
jgi:hypothetical protein